MSRRTNPHGSPSAAEARARVRRELSRLDPWSFWSVPAGPGYGADFLVVGTTGAFVVRAHEGEGIVGRSLGAIRLGDRPVGGTLSLRRGAKRLQARLNQAAVYTDVEPLVCFTRATMGAPMRAGKIRAVPLADLARDIGGRSATVSPSRARRGAEVLGAFDRDRSA